jgi:hypothetical protein
MTKPTSHTGRRSTGVVRRSAGTEGRVASRQHAEWVRTHVPIDDGGFPAYPDEKLRRGASRGALANGNPWRPESDAEKPGPRWTRDPVGRDVKRIPRTTPRRSAIEAPPPPGEPAPVAVTRGAITEAERRIAADVGKQLALSKTFDGTSIEVEVRGNDVSLRGRVPTRNARSEARSLASSVRGVRSVDDQLRVGKSRSTPA